MRTPDWRTFTFRDGVLREPVADPARIVLWIPGGSEDGFRHWHRVGTVPGAAITTGGGVCAVPATAVRARQLEGSGILGRLFGRRKGAPPGRTWVLPTGESAEQCGDRQTDLVLAWADDGAPALDETRLKGRWPESRRVRMLGPNLALVSGVLPPPPVAEVAVPPGSPGEQAERALAAARTAGD